ncbi:MULTISPECIES: DUF2970 domain-containing protein [Spongiibacter]|jgi:hypothetical protein|uniref:DUF2970 domain-containing protein n=1 Tax=Spongiibacter TaxID=630749 RepID=UPI0003B514DB|nr:MULTISPECIES: DUF2970 domain-containing protein [Spongiibacter]MAY37461.1 DUF2970 domain-containing protein [Spongiibacter sp.]MBI58708.1 DUF2970 domain-containing protein [Spongiibacter sp.]MBO6752067.1 DUF2970 domain-containing protein [Spongiibacter sp.]MBU70552.1 DUF2970 domain-containing protein [Spongiibacter sp.]|tara:strand:+ start:14207 stop:14428 length:222 start_codon:yes stop_codon:yes gene_type:complete
MTDPDKKDEKKPGPLQVVGSVISAAFGVQSSRNRERDFQHGRFRNYVIAAVGFVMVFIVVVFSVVQMVLKSAG